MTLKCGVVQKKGVAEKGNKIIVFCKKREIEMSVRKRETSTKKRRRSPRDKIFESLVKEAKRRLLLDSVIPKTPEGSRWVDYCEIRERSILQETEEEYKKYGTSLTKSNFTN